MPPPYPDSPLPLPPPQQSEVLSQALRSSPVTESTEPVEAMHPLQVVGTPTERLEAQRYVESGPSDTPVASSSHGHAGSTLAVTTHPPVEVELTKGLTRKVSGTCFPIHPKPTMKDLAITRTFMHKAFGAHPTKRYSEPPRTMMAQHHYDHFLFLDAVRKKCSPLLYA
jgi:hypothetical protein